MPGDVPRLLVTVPPRPTIDEAFREVLPDVPWTYLSASPGRPLDRVEALLVGSPDREFGSFDPARLPQLRFVQRLFTGLDGFPFDRFPAGVRVAGNVGGYAPFVAEHAVALALAVARATRAGFERVAAGALRPAPFQTSLRGRTAVLLGYGAIGREIARRLEGFGMRRIGVNRSGRASPGVDRVYPAEDLDAALTEADLLFEARPLTRATRGSLDAGRFARMPDDAIFVNVGRAGTVVEADLYHHLVTHPTFRAALDVWWDEDYAAGRLATGHPWATLPNFLGTPHSAAILGDAERYGIRRALANLRRFFDGTTPPTSPSAWSTWASGAAV
ncbi:D-isomer specific 2-hydroxyacid dehydrogenase NAD-binding protein [mine drainage metagenome]|uniref:D-isomer specific 2-hydroxyacid dehydrogenase NAD-binding protein n=1 Tax=mine drainage metagenome TaxID=410659 RepID=T0YHM6_9ZZZZ